MSEYGSGLTIGQAAELDKQRVQHALQGELMSGEDENGFTYVPASKEECDAFILDVLDNWVYQAKELADSGRAMERLMDAHGFNWQNHFAEYMALRSEASSEHNDYLYESDKAELHEQARQVLEEGLQDER